MINLGSYKRSTGHNRKTGESNQFKCSKRLDIFEGGRIKILIIYKALNSGSVYFRHKGITKRIASVTANREKEKKK